MHQKGKGEFQLKVQVLDLAQLITSWTEGMNHAL